MPQPQLKLSRAQVLQPFAFQTAGFNFEENLIEQLRFRRESFTEVLHDCLDGIRICALDDDNEIRTVAERFGKAGPSSMKVGRWVDQVGTLRAEFDKHDGDQDGSDGGQSCHAQSQNRTCTSGFRDGAQRLTEMKRASVVGPFWLHAFIRVWVGSGVSATPSEVAADLPAMLRKTSR